MSFLQDLTAKVKLYLKLKRFEAAEKILKSAIASQGDHSGFYLLLGRTYHQQSRFDESIQFFQKALELNTTDPEPKLHLIATLCDLGRYEEAASHYQQLQTASSPHEDRVYHNALAEEHYLTGKKYEQADMLNEAVNEYRRAINLIHDYLDAALAIAKIHLQKRNFEQAQIELENLVRKHPNNGRIRSLLGVTYFNLEKKQEAHAQWDLAQQSDIKDKSVTAYWQISQQMLKGQRT